VTDARPLVAHVIHHLVIGGMENGLVNLINRLPHDEFRHAVLCIEDFSDFRARIARPEVEVIALRRSKIGVMALRRELFRRFRQWRPSVVHSRGQSGLDALPPAWLAGVPARVHGEHGWDMGNLDGQQWKPRLLRRLHSPLVSRYVAVSRDLARFVVQDVGIDARRVRTISNGVDTERFAPGPIDADLGLPAAWLDDRIVRVGTVGRLQPVKDQATLIDAVALAIEREPALRERLRLIIVGDGPSRDALHGHVEARGIRAITHFTGASPRVAHWLRALDVFVLPSLNEGMSNTLLEAMASGCPTLATPVGGNVELVDDGRTGIFFPVGDAPALGQRLLAYARDPALRRAHGQAARERALRDFSLNAMVAAYRATYRELLAATTP
jgi:sugar transferase (PEP-CTERM/EpsH1 system associated)